MPNLTRLLGILLALTSFASAVQADDGAEPPTSDGDGSSEPAEPQTTSDPICDLTGFCAAPGICSTRMSSSPPQQGQGEVGTPYPVLGKYIIICIGEEDPGNP